MPRRRRRPPPVVEDAKALLSARYTEHLTLEELGREVNVSPFHLARSFRRHTGYTLHEYRVHLRLRAALERLAAGDEDLAVIARAVGFSSHSHLTATFRRAFGVPPSCVRKRALPAPCALSKCAGSLHKCPRIESPGRAQDGTARVNGGRGLDEDRPTVGRTALALACASLLAPASASAAQLVVDDDKLRVPERGLHDHRGRGGGRASRATRSASATASTARARRAPARPR